MSRAENKEFKDIANGIFTPAEVESITKHADRVADAEKRLQRGEITSINSMANEVYGPIKPAEARPDTNRRESKIGVFVTKISKKLGL